MADTITRECKKCEEEFDSIFEIDRGYCDICIEKIQQQEDNFKFNSIGKNKVI
jgi:hypothetical protein